MSPRYGLLFTTGQRPVADTTAVAVAKAVLEPPGVDPHAGWCGSRDWPSRVSLGEPIGSRVSVRDLSDI